MFEKIKRLFKKDPVEITVPIQPQVIVKNIDTIPLKAKFIIPSMLYDRLRDSGEDIDEIVRCNLADKFEDLIKDNLHYYESTDYTNQEKIYTAVIHIGFEERQW